MMRGKIKDVETDLTKTAKPVHYQSELSAACEQDQDGTAFHPDPARKLSANLFDIYHCCVYSEELLMMDRGTVRNMWSFISRINLRN